MITLTTCALALAPALPDVLVVDPFDPNAYHEIWPAVANAVDGDVVLVSPGLYDTFKIDGKAVSVVGTDEGVFVFGVVRVQNLGPGQNVVVANMDIRTIFADNDAALVLGSSSGSIRIQDVQVKTFEKHGMRIHSCSDVSIDFAEIEGGGSFSTTSAATAEGLLIQASQVTISNSSIATDYEGAESEDGPDGIRASASDITLIRTVVRGGNGEAPFCYVDPNGCQCFQPGGDGGAGVSLLGGSLRRFQSPCIGGAGGPGGFLCVSGTSGPRVLVTGGATEVEFSEEAPTLDGPNLVHSGADVEFAFGGSGGAPIFIAFAIEPGRQHVPALLGDLLVEPSTMGLRRQFVGFAPGTFVIEMPSVAAGESTQVHAQAMAVTQTTTVLGATRVVTVVGEP